MRRVWGWLWQRAGLAHRDGESLGLRGERLAERWLRARGYHVLDRNLRLGDDEADLVAVDPDQRTIVLVEVKTRSSAEPAPEFSIDPTKRHRLSRLAARLSRQKGYAERPFRFDVIAIIWPDHAEPEVRHHPGAFESTI